ncbi:MAG: glycosyltransferase family 39 protein [Chloroflexi bacterium]|nr:glycosyltransferase family 39 protein [Chloroflexota bacterium]
MTDTGASTRRTLIALLLVALGLRLAYGLSLDPHAPYTDRGGDTWWYLDTGYRFIAGEVPVVVPSGPGYLVFAGFWQRVFGKDSAAAIYAIRIAHALLSTATVYFAYLMARRLSENARAGLFAAAIMTISPVFVLEQAQVLTETLYLALVTGGLALFLAVVARARVGETVSAGTLAVTGAIFGLATLTRAVFLLYPLALAIFLAWLGKRRAVRHAAILLAVYAGVVLSYTAYNLIRFNEFVIGAQGITSFAYMGARGWSGPEGLDAQLLEDVPEHADDDPNLTDRDPALVEGTLRAITADPLGYAWRRVSELGGAYLQPHGTVLFPGESLKELARAWIDEERSLDGLARLVRGDWFAAKLALYLFHGVALVFGALGIWLTRRRWPLTLPLAGFIAYLTLVHLVLMVTPRYLFPLEPVFVVFAACALWMLWLRWRAQRTARSAG